MIKNFLINKYFLIEINYNFFVIAMINRHFKAKSYLCEFFEIILSKKIILSFIFIFQLFLNK